MEPVEGHHPDTRVDPPVDTSPGCAAANRHLSHHPGEAGGGFDQLAPVGQIRETHFETVATGAARGRLRRVSYQTHRAQTADVYAKFGHQSTPTASRYFKGEGCVEIDVGCFRGVVLGDGLERYVVSGEHDLDFG